jgi:hypothetical protein
LRSAAAHVSGHRHRRRHPTPYGALPAERQPHAVTVPSPSRPIAHHAGLTPRPAGHAPRPRQCAHHASAWLPRVRSRHRGVQRCARG